MTKKEIGARIAKIRKSMGLSQMEFASLAGLSQGQLHNYESGLHYPALPVFDRICRAADVHMGDMIAPQRGGARRIPTEQEIGQNIGKWRALKGVTAEDLAGKSGVSATSVLALERGERYGVLTTYLYLAAALDVSLNALIYGEE